MKSITGSLNLVGNIEDKAFDPLNNGYIEALSRTGSDD